VADPVPRLSVPPLPLLRLPGLPSLSRLVPSRRSLAVGLLLLAAAGGAYALARETSAFAVQRIEVVGGSGKLRAQVRQSLASVRGTSLVSLDGAALERRLEALPTVRSATYDRAFPHTLRVSVVPERPVAVLHRGLETWLVSGRGRVILRIPNGTHPKLARLWVPRATPVAAGALLAPDGPGAATLALAVATRFPARIATASLAQGELTLRLRSGLVLRLGEPTDVRLKLAIAARALRRVAQGTTYVDVSVPGRPVAGNNPQVSGGG
jgi:cell division protein FtsQ